jgi:hypothetical protein
MSMVLPCDVTGGRGVVAEAGVLTTISTGTGAMTLPQDITIPDREDYVPFVVYNMTTKIAEVDAAGNATFAGTVKAARFDGPCVTVSPGLDVFLGASILSATLTACILAVLTRIRNRHTTMRAAP